MVNQIFNKADTDGSGEIEYSEFVAATLNERDLLSQDRLKAAFKMFDKDDSGSISVDEIKQAL